MAWGPERLDDLSNYLRAEFPMDPQFPDRWPARTRAGKLLFPQRLMRLFDAARWAFCCCHKFALLASQPDLAGDRMRGFDLHEGTGFGDGMAALAVGTGGSRGNNSDLSPLSIREQEFPLSRKPLPEVVFEGRKSGD